MRAPMPTAPSGFPACHPVAIRWWPGTSAPRRGRARSRWVPTGSRASRWSSTRAAIASRSIPTRKASPMRGAGGAISRPLSGLALRIFLATALVTAVALALALVVTGRRASRTADATLERALGATRTAVEDALDARSVALERVAVGLAGVPTYVTRITEALRVGDRAELLDQADEFRSQLDAAWVLITDREGTLAAWTRDRARSGEALGGGALVGQALAGETTRGFWVEPTAGGDSLFQAVGVPLF